MARNTSPTFDFAGVVVKSLPTAQKHHPLEVTVRVEQGSEVRYEETRTVEDVTNGVAFRVTKDWMVEPGPYEVTVSSPVHEPKKYTTGRLAKEDRIDKFKDKSVYFGFELTGNTILFRPIPES
ncbi:hypothetical protein [Haloarchaeobius sp. TZWSO28]|uniref:hypothetical protein n=1 Tax=Haloarchaeobius sp. TZWSO28 TaxID=3446119 RepID=UPI003EBEE215